MYRVDYIRVQRSQDLEEGKQWKVRGYIDGKRAGLTLAKVQLKELTHLKVTDGSLPNFGVVWCKFGNLFLASEDWSSGNCIIHKHLQVF